MAFVYADRIKETSTHAATTGTLNLDGGAAAGFQSFVAGIGTGNTCTYCIVEGTAWEVGEGTVTDAAPDTLSRTLIASSTGSLLSLTSASKDVFCVRAARDTGALPRGYIDGLDTSRASATTISVAVGEARDDADTDNIVLAATITKTEAAWAVGNNNGGLDGTESSAGVYDNDTWYYVYLIKRPDTGVVDVLFSENKTTPTMPTNYTKSRLIGMFYHETGGSTDILNFVQSGDYWSYSPAAFQVLSTTAPATTWTALSLATRVPPIAGALARGYMALRKSSTADVSAGMQSGLVGAPTNVWDGELYAVNHHAAANDDVTINYAIPVDASGQVQYMGSTVTSIRIQLYVTGFTWSRGKG